MALTLLDRMLLLEDWSSKEEDEAHELAEDFGRFIRAAWPVLEAGPLTDEWYIDALADHGAAIARREILALMVHIRPRMLKTTILDIMLGAWIFTWSPSARLLCGTYSESRCDEDSRKTRALICSEWYQARWPRPMAADQSVKSRFALASGGQRYSAIYGTGATGDGGNFLFLGDPQNSRDMWSPTNLDRDHSWFYDTWERRRDDGANSPMLITTQRLACGDLCGRLRYDDPTRWQVLGLQTRKTIVEVAEYRRGESVKRLPLVDTLLSRDGRFVDPREPGDLLSSRVNADELNAMEESRPQLFAAQEQQAPILAASEGARVHMFDRDRHLSSFATRLNCSTVLEAVHLALSSGWRFTTGWDHGVTARREICVILAYHEALKEMWALATYANSGRTTPDMDAREVRRMLDDLGIPIRTVVESSGDVGSMGKGAADNVSESINAALEDARYDDGTPVLGFHIYTAEKGPGSVERGTEILNVAFGSGALYLDEACGMLASALEGWTGGETLKDFVDAFRYGATYRLDKWQSGGIGYQ